MVIVRNFDLHKYNLPVQGDGFVNTVADFVSQNKDLLKDVGASVSGAAGNISGAVGNISEAIKAAKRLNELQLAKNKLTQKVIEKLKSETVDKKGDGFEKF
jgi:hypothetical protein